MSLHYEHVQTKIGFGKDKTDMYVGKRRLADPFDIKRLAKEVSHITGQREAQVLITLQYLTQAIEDAIQDGRSIDLGFGTLSPAITTKAADEASDVKVVGKRVLFRASKELREIVQKMSVRLISDQDDGTSDTEDDDPTDDGGGTGTDTDGSQQQGGSPVLTVAKSGTGTMTLTDQSGHQVDSGSSVTAGQTLTLSVTPAGSATPTATIGTQTVTLTEDEGQWVGTFTMPAASATLTVRTGGTGDNEE